MPNENDKEIRAAIATVIAAAEPNARVYGWNVLDHHPDDWPGLFRTEAGGVHGWIVRRREIKSEWKRTGIIDRRFAEYDIFGFYGFRSGMAGDNSDDEFAAICDGIYEAIKATPDLELPAIVERHELLQFAAMTTTRPGEETMHFAHGRLKVALCC